MVSYVDVTDVGFSRPESGFFDIFDFFLENKNVFKR
jgi:hypothetical protein